jgi:hypothetical protein
MSSRIIIIIFFFFSQTDTFASDIYYGENAGKYVAKKSFIHDILIMGEHHWIKDEIDFFLEMIPVLYDNGVRCFAFEFMSYNTQNLIDSLIGGEIYNVDLQNYIISKKPQWFFYEYQNILYSLWSFNCRKNDKIKVIALDYPSGQKFAEKDSLMAKLVSEYFDEHQNKVLVYCGINHGLTRFYQCKSNGEEVIRMGNILYNRYQEKVSNILFLPFLFRTNEQELKYCKTPLDDFLDKQAGYYCAFDLHLSNFSDFRCSDVMMANNHSFTLGSFYDGAIYLKPSSRFIFCSIAKEWLFNHLPDMLQEMEQSLEKMKLLLNNTASCACCYRK